MKKLHYNGPVVLAVLDGVGLRTARSGNAFRQAHTEFLDHALANYLNIPLAASGEAVGIMPGQMGNSEVGHNALGSGQIIKQGVASIEAAFATGDIWNSKAWKDAMKWLGADNYAKSEDDAFVGIFTANEEQTKRVSPITTVRNEASPKKHQICSTHITGTLHFCGIFSDGGIHSDIRHLEQMITQAYKAGIRRIRIHALFDGRDVPPQSALEYLERLEEFCTKFPDADIRIASGAGRMVAVADRYGNDWGMVKLGWDMIAHGQAPREFKSARDAIKTFRREDPKIQDQYLPAFVVVENAAASSALVSRAARAKSSAAEQKHGARPIGAMQDGDVMIYYDFRADRAVEIAAAFTDPAFKEFDRGKIPQVLFVGLTEYDSDRHIPKHTLVPPVEINAPLNTFLGQQQISQFAISETVKFGHITYYFNGNSYKQAPHEEHFEVASDANPYYNTRPWMKAAEITDIVLDKLDQYQFIRINYPNGDMVGHFGELESAIIAVEAIDLQLARLARRIDELGGILLITADHGNVEELIDRNGIAKTSHTTNPVPCIFYDNTPNRLKYHAADLKHPGLANIAATITRLLGLADYPASWQPPLIES